MEGDGCPDLLPPPSKEVIHDGEEDREEHRIGDMDMDGKSVRGLGRGRPGRRSRPLQVGHGYML